MASSWTARRGRIASPLSRPSEMIERMTPIFAPYKGELSSGLAAGDTMEAVEQKLDQPWVPHAPQAGREPGLPD